MPTPRDEDLQRAVFRDVHATRLYGFALLIALGNRRSASDAATDALADGARRLPELRHPERAAAWLRAHVLRSLRGSDLGSRPAAADRLAALTALRTLAVDGPLLNGLAGLPVRERAALVASAVERLRTADVAMILGTTPAAAQRLVAAARARYLAAAADTLADATATPGPLGERVLTVAARGFARPAGRPGRTA